jgi:hypothetical protein
VLNTLLGHIDKLCTAFTIHQNNRMVHTNHELVPVWLIQRR